MSDPLPPIPPDPDEESRDRRSIILWLLLFLLLILIPAAVYFGPNVFGSSGFVSRLLGGGAERGSGPTRERPGRGQRLR